MIPEFVRLFGLTLYVPLFFIMAGVLVSPYVVWREARKEGFDEEQTFDMMIAVVIGAFFIGRIVFALSNFPDLLPVVTHIFTIWLPGVDLYGFFIGGFVVMYIWAKHKRWSIYRIVDIASMGITIFVPFVVVPFGLVLGQPTSLILGGLLILIHALLIYLRRKGFVFGGLFGLTLILVSGVLSIFYRDQKSLLILPFLFTLGVVVLYRRIKSNKVRMKTNMSNDLLKNIKDLLSKKDKQLAKEESILDKNDPYKVNGRDVGNSEFEDEASEDADHTTTQLLKKSVFDMRTQVRKALAKINIGTYGICEVCHKPIDSARLKAFPQATLCLSCAEKKDR